MARGRRMRRQQGGRGRRRYQRGSRQMGRKYAGHSHGLGMAVSGSTWAGYHGHNVNIDNPLHRAEMSGGMHPHSVTPWGSPEFSSVSHDHTLGGGSSHHTPGGAHPHYMSSSYDAGHAHGVSGLGEHQHPRHRFPGGHPVRQRGGKMNYRLRKQRGGVTRNRVNRQRGGRIRRQMGGNGNGLPKPWDDD